MTVLCTLSIKRLQEAHDKSLCIVNIVQACLCWLQWNIIKVEMLCNDFTISRQWYRMTSLLGFMLGIKLEGTSIENSMKRAGDTFGQPKNTLGK